MITVQSKPISTRTPIAFPGTISLWIYRDIDLLRTEARQHAAEREGDDDLGDDLLAVFQPDEYRVIVDDEERVTEPPEQFAGILRIHHEASPEVISHEHPHSAPREGQRRDRALERDLEPSHPQP